MKYFLCQIFRRLFRTIQTSEFCLSVFLAFLPSCEHSVFDRTIYRSLLSFCELHHSSFGDRASLISHFFRRIISFSYFLYRCGNFFEYLIIEHCPLIKSKWIVHFGSSSLVADTTLFRNNLVAWSVIVSSLFSTSFRVYLSFGLTNTLICFVNHNESKFWGSISTGWPSLLWWHHRLIRNR